MGSTCSFDEENSPRSAPTATTTRLAILATQEKTEALLSMGLSATSCRSTRYWTHEHRRAMAEARRRRGSKPFDLGEQKAKSVPRLLGWRAVGSRALRATT